MAWHFTRTDFITGESIYTGDTAAVGGFIGQADTYTVMVWVKPDSITSTDITDSACETALSSSVTTDEPSDSQNACWFYDSGTSAYEVVVRHATAGGGGSSGFEWKTTDAPITLGEWNLVSYNVTSSSNMDIYVNGVESASGQEIAPKKAAMTTGDTGLVIGAADKDDGFFDGAIAEIAVWTVLLTSSEHAALAQGANPLTIRPQSLRRYLPLIRDRKSPLDGLNPSNTWGTPSAANDHPPVRQLARPFVPVLVGGGTVNNLLADNLQSASQLSTPSVGQEHAVLADNLQSASQLSTPTLQQENALLADDLQSASQLSTPAITETNVVLADNLQGASQLSTPALAQDQQLLADDLQGASQLSTPTLQQENTLLADDIQSASQLSTPSLAESNQLLADDLQSASELSTPAITQDQQILADDLQSASELSTPAVAQENALLADDLQSASQLSEPTVEAVTSVANLLADDLQGASQLSTPAVAQDQTLTADDLQGASQLSTPALSEQSILLADDLQSASQLSTPAIAQENTLLADDLQSAAQLSEPTVAETLLRLVPDADIIVGNWTTHTGSATNLYQQIDEDSANDSDFIQSEVAPSASAVKFSLSNEAVTAADTQRVKYRYGKDADDGVQLDLTVSLIEGASTVRATWTHTNIGTTLTTADQLLTAPQKAAITDYDNLYIQFEASI